MGLSSSQARMLSLTARLSDLELQGQTISNTKIRLADAASDASEEYQNALSSEYITVLDSDKSTYVQATAHNLTSYQAISELDKQRMLKTSAGQLVISSSVAQAYDDANGSENAFLAALNVETNPTSADYDASKVTYYRAIFNQIASNGYYSPGDNNMNDSDWLYEQLSAGNIYLYTDEDNDDEFEAVSWSSGDSSLATEKDEARIAKAEAEYEATMKDIESKEVKLDLNLKEIDTQHNAIQTEMDSVQKVMDKNIERTFKIFDA